MLRYPMKGPLPMPFGELVAKLVGWAVPHLMEWGRKINFSASDWKVWYFHRDRNYGSWRWCEEAPANGGGDAPGGLKVQFTFTIRMFSGKSESTGLHGMSVEFTRGPWIKRQVVARVDKLYHGPASIQSHQIRHRDLRDIRLPSHEPAVEDVTRFLDSDPRLKGADAVWFVAHLPNGKRCRWELARTAPANEAKSRPA